MNSSVCAEVAVVFEPSTATLAEARAWRDSQEIEVLRLRQRLDSAWTTRAVDGRPYRLAAARLSYDLAAHLGRQVMADADAAVDMVARRVQAEGLPNSELFGERFNLPDACAVNAEAMRGHVSRHLEGLRGLIRMVAR